MSGQEKDGVGDWDVPKLGGMIDPCVLNCFVSLWLMRVVVCWKTSTPPSTWRLNQEYLAATPQGEYFQGTSGR